MKNKTFKVGDQVFAKVKGYPAWPATVTGKKDNVNGKRYNVKFYGTEEVASLTSDHLFYYLKHKHNFAKNSKHKKFRESLVQIEEAVTKAGTDGNDNADDELTDVSTVSVGEKVNRKRKRSLTLTDTPASHGRRSSTADSHTDEDLIDNQGEAEKKSKQALLSSEPVIIDSDTDTASVTFVAEKNVDKKEYTEPKLVSEFELKACIAYAEYIRCKPEIYKERPVEPRDDDPCAVLAVKLPDSSLKAIKLHDQWPLKFETEWERAMYDEEVAKRVLKLKDDLLIGAVDPLALYMPKYLDGFDKMCTDEEVQLRLQEELLRLTKAKTERLKCESQLVECDVKIKGALGMDSAEPKEALKHMEELEKVDLDDLMLIKHPHVVDGVRRLKKYVGNVNGWKLDAEELRDFEIGAQKIRSKADKIWTKIKGVIKVPDTAPNFYEGFTEVVYKFRQATKHLPENKIIAISSEPHSRQFFMDQYDEKIEFLAPPPAAK